MNEAERCDRISLMHAGRVLVSDAPAELVRQRDAATLEQAFIAWLREAQVDDAAVAETPAAAAPAAPAADAAPRRARRRRAFDWQRALGYARREALELRRDPVRGLWRCSARCILMFIMGYGISMDVEDLRYAVLDRTSPRSARAIR